MEENQELLFKLSMFEQQMRQLQQQVEAIEHGIIELSSLNFDLNELKKSEGKEIFAPVGRGIFAKAKLISEDLTVDIGNKNFVKKTIPETQKMIESQVEKLDSVKNELGKALEEVSNEANSLIENAQNNGKEM